MVSLDLLGYARPSILLRGKGRNILARLSSGMRSAFACLRKGPRPCEVHATFRDAAVSAYIIDRRIVTMKALQFFNPRRLK